MDQLGEKIRALREAREWTQEKLAGIVGMTSDHLSRIERGEATNPGIQTLMKIAEALGVEVKDLLNSAA